MKVEYIVFGVVGVIVLWFLSRYAGSSAPTIDYVMAPQPDPSSGDAQAQLDAETRLGALGMLASLAQTETQTRAQLEATGIAAQAQLFASQIAADLQRAGIAADERLGLRQIEAQENIYLSDLQSRAAQEQLHAKTVTDFVREHRGKISTDSSTVIFNALSSAFRKEQIQFAPERTPWYAPITQGLGRLIGGLPIAIGVRGVR
jgi:hypothetical protein